MKPCANPYMQQNANLTYTLTNYDTSLYGTYANPKILFRNHMHVKLRSGLSLYTTTNIEYLYGYMSKYYENTIQKCFNNK